MPHGEPASPSWPETPYGSRTCRPCGRISLILVVGPNITVNSGSEQERLGLIEAMAQNVCNSFDSLRGATPAAYGPELAMTKLLQADWIAISPVLQSILDAGPETQQRCLDAVDEIIKS